MEETKQVVLISGMSGAGKSTVVRIFEDMGYHCIDNFPVQLLSLLVDMIESSNDPRYSYVALATTAQDFPEFLRSLKGEGIVVRVLFLEASTSTLLTRYKSTRRAHPLLLSNTVNTLEEAIAVERQMFQNYIQDSFITIDTTFITEKELKKKVLFAAINDAKTCHELLKLEVGSETEINLGIGIDELTTPAKLKVRVNYKGNQEGTHMYGEEGNYGPLVTVHVLQTNIDIAITDNNHSFVEEHQIATCGVDWDDYDIIVVKQGYIHPEEKAKGKLCVMSLTDGATPQDTRLIKFKRIMRPMYPIDEI